MEKLTVQQAIKLGIEQLQQAGLDSDTLKLDCEILLLDAMNHSSAPNSQQKKNQNLVANLAGTCTFQCSDTALSG